MKGGWFRLLLILGVEGRLEQQGRWSYRMLQRVEGGMLALQNRGKQADVHARIHARRRTVGRVLPTIPGCQRQAR